MASGHEILQYIRDVNDKFELDRWISFNNSLQEAVWNEESGKWQLSGTVLRLTQLFVDGC